MFPGWSDLSSSSHCSKSRVVLRPHCAPGQQQSSGPQFTKTDVKVICALKIVKGEVPTSIADDGLGLGNKTVCHFHDNISLNNDDKFMTKFLGGF